MVVVVSDFLSKLWVLEPVEVIEPNDLQGMRGNFLAPAALSGMIGKSIPDPRVVVRFFDSTGREWQRVDNGLPTKASGPLAPGEPEYHR